jgi:hypothetical protein
MNPAVKSATWTNGESSPAQGHGKKICGERWYGAVREKSALILSLYNIKDISNSNAYVNTGKLSRPDQPIPISATPSSGCLRRVK